ncbi:MAG: hypothetical protein IJ160_11415 [Muribaculaceae bacterium]|nr:hypothetical protein [Muribaculaceae bacterium]
MEYYTLKTSSDEKLIGCYPQVDCHTIFQAQLLSPAELMKCAPALIFEFKRRALKTDVLATTSGPVTDFLVNDKAWSVFSEFNLMRHQVFDVTVASSNKSHVFHWLHFTQPELSLLLDYQHTEFIKTEYGISDAGPIRIESFDHYLKLKRKDRSQGLAFGVRLNQIALSQDFDFSLDLFHFDPFDSRTFISKRLRDRIEEINLTGLDIQKIDILSSIK